jgi:nitrogen-specific signal transduction histidine kinase
MPGISGEGKRMGFLDKAKDLLAQNADKVETAIDKAGEFVDDKTQGKYSVTIHKVADEAKKVADSATKGDQQN